MIVDREYHDAEIGINTTTVKSSIHATETSLTSSISSTSLSSSTSSTYLTRSPSTCLPLECELSDSSWPQTQTKNIPHRRLDPFPSLHIALEGSTLALMTGFANMKIASASLLAANVGLASTALFAIGGVCGQCHGKRSYLVPACALQIAALTYLCVAAEYDERYMDIYADSFGD